MKLDLTFAHVPLEIGTVRDLATVIAKEEARLEERTRDHIWEQWDKNLEEERSTGGYLEDLVERGISLRFLPAASVVASWSVYESTVKRMARYLQRKHGIEEELESMKGGFIRKARSYCGQSLHTELHPPSFDWSMLEEVAEVRHAFAHANGRLADVKKDRRRSVEQRVKAAKELRLEDGYIIPSGKYAVEVAEFIDGAVRELIERLAPVVPSANPSQE